MKPSLLRHLFAGLVLCIGAAPAHGQAADLFISEYIEGSSNNKAVELHNATGAPLDLEAGSYRLEVYFNGGRTPGTVVTLAGMVDDGEVFVVADADADPAILAHADQVTASTLFNGDDAVLLRRDGPTGPVVDAIGQVGFDPGSQWGAGLLSTADNTLRRRPDRCTGDPNPDDDFEPNLDPASGEWDGFARDTFGGLGQHQALCDGPPPASLLLTELVVRPNRAAFIELFNPNPEAVDLSHVYLTDATDRDASQLYFQIVTGEDAGGGDRGDFHARFPEGAQIGPEMYQTVALSGSDAFTAAYGLDPTYEFVEDAPAPDAIPDLRPAFPGSIDARSRLGNDGEVVILYFWNGRSDLVTDLDVALWGDRQEAVDKTGRLIDGPDPGTEATAYHPETPIAQQGVIAGRGHAAGHAFMRLDLTEGTERRTGGNGVDGHDETSENLGETWAEVAVPTPGGPPPPPPPPVLNEFVANHEGPDTDEFIELRGTPLADYAAYTLLGVEGDAGGTLGRIDHVFPAGTTDAQGFWTTGFLGSTLENGSLTLLLVASFTGRLGDDLDADDDGHLDPAPPWHALVDAVAVSDGDPFDAAYTEVVLRPGFDGRPDPPGGASRLPDGADTDRVEDWLRNDFGGDGLPSSPTAPPAPAGLAVNTPGHANRAGVTPPPPPPPPGLLLNEVDPDTPGTDTREFIELFDGGIGHTPLDDLVIVLFNGSTGRSYAAFDLGGFRTDADGFFVMGNSGLEPPPDLPFPAATLQNGPDAVALFAGSLSTFPDGSPLTTAFLVDAVVYGPRDDRALRTLLLPGEKVVAERGAPGREVSLQRLPNGSGSPRRTAAFAALPPTPGGINGGADLSLKMQVTDLDQQPDARSYTLRLRLTNDGPARATGISLATQLPDAMTLAAADTEGSMYDPTLGLWTIPALEAGEAALLHLFAQAPRHGRLEHRAEVAGVREPDPDSSPGDGQGDDAALAVLGRGGPPPSVLTADLRLSLTATPAGDARNAALALTLTNDGPAITAGVEAALRLAEGLAVVSSSGDGRYEAASGLWTVGALRDGASATLTLFVASPTAGVYTSTAEIVASHLPDPDSDPGNADPAEDDAASATLDLPAATAKNPEAAARLAPALPAVLTLGAPFPHPAGHQATIPFALPTAAPVRMTVVDLLGRTRTVLLDQPMDAGWHLQSWNTNVYPSGVYLIRLQVAHQHLTRRLVVLK